MKKKNIIRALVASGSIGLIHYLLHSVGKLEFGTVGIWLVVVIFIYIAFVEDKLFKK